VAQKPFPAHLAPRFTIGTKDGPVALPPLFEIESDKGADKIFIPVVTIRVVVADSVCLERVAPCDAEPAPHEVIPADAVLS